MEPYNRLCDPILVQAVMNSDVEVLNKYITSGKSLLNINRCSLKDFDPTYEFIDYVISTNKRNVINKISEGLLDNKNLTKISYFIDKLLEQSNKYAMSLFKQAITNYVNQWFHFRYIIPSEHILYYKIMLSLTIDHIKNYIKLSDIVTHINIIKNSGNIDAYNIVTFDTILYLVFEIINDDILKNTNNDILELLVLLSIQMSVSDVLTDTLLKYLNDDSPFKSQSYRDKIVRYIIPEAYVSLFEESI